MLQSFSIYKYNMNKSSSVRALLEVLSHMSPQLSEKREKTGLFLFSHKVRTNEERIGRALGERK